MEESYKTEKLMRKVRVQYILPDKEARMEEPHT
jgi:hypothetical protein